jgi:hypothetical protein
LLGGGGELVDVGAAYLVLAPSGRHELVDELADQLAGVRGELPALLGCGLLVDERLPDAPMDLLDRRERVGSGEHSRAVLRERDVERRGVLPVDRGEAVGVKTPPRPGAGARGRAR